MSTTQTSHVRYPEADTLDTRDLRSGDMLKIYLVPSQEDTYGVPYVTLLHAIGGSGRPMAAHHNRWVWIGTVGPNTVGASVLATLRSLEPLLLAIDDTYLGAEWDGDNIVGRWDVATDAYDAIDDDDPRTELRSAWRDATERHLQHYWDAVDWYGPGGYDWPTLAREYAVDPDSILGDPDWRDAVRNLAERIESDQDEPVTGTAKYLEPVAEEYRDERGA